MSTNKVINKKRLLRKNIFVAGIILLLIIPVLVFIVLSLNPKPDPASEILIRYNALNAINKDTGNSEVTRELTNDDFAQITKLRIDPSLDNMLGDFDMVAGRFHPLINIADINMLKKFTNLQEFELLYAKYPNEKIPKWMKVLDRYGILDLEERMFIDLKPLENLKHLKKLDFTLSDIKNIEPLANLKNLESLNLSYTNVSNIKPLKKLRNLKSLNIFNCNNIPQKQIEDLRKALPDLEIATHGDDE